LEHLFQGETILQHADHITDEGQGEGKEEEVINGNVQI
jgi:hypothetical protein